MRQVKRAKAGASPAQPWIAEGEGGWAEEQSVPVVAGDGSFLSPHSLRSGQALSGAKGLARWALRCFAALSMTGVPCHPERSEGSRSMGAEMLRCAQHDRGAVSP